VQVSNLPIPMGERVTASLALPWLVRRVGWTPGRFRDFPIWGVLSYTMSTMGCSTGLEPAKTGDTIQRLDHLSHEHSALGGTRTPDPFLVREVLCR
jgi:hypothetical protein